MKFHKTVYIVVPDPRNPIGGAEASLLQMLKFSFEERQRCLIITSGTGDFSAACQELGVETRIIPMVQPLSVGKRSLVKVLVYLGKVLITAQKIAQIITKSNIGLICTLGRSAHPFGCVAGWLTKRPVVMHIHDIPQNPFAILSYRILIQHFARCAILFSRAVFRAIGKANQKMIVLPMGIDLELFKPLQNPIFREKLALQDSFPVICSAGRLAPQKGFTELVSAFAQVSQVFPKATFLIAGQVWNEDKHYKQALETQIAALGIKENVIFVGQLSTDQMPEFWAAADIVATASHFESFGLTVIEGMAMQKPVLATRCGGPEEIISHGIDGFLVEVGDVDSFAKVLIQLANDENLRLDVGKRGSEKAKKYYDVSYHTSSILAIHQNILQKN